MFHRYDGTVTFKIIGIDCEVLCILNITFVSYLLHDHDDFVVFHQLEDTVTFKLICIVCEVLGILTIPLLEFLYT